MQQYRQAIQTPDIRLRLFHFQDLLMLPKNVQDYPDHRHLDHYHLDRHTPDPDQPITPFSSFIAK